MFIFREKVPPGKTPAGPEGTEGHQQQRICYYNHFGHRGTLASQMSKEIRLKMLILDRQRLLVANSDVENC